MSVDRWIVGGLIVALVARLFSPGNESAYEWVTLVAVYVFGAAALGLLIVRLVQRTRRYKRPQTNDP